MATYTVVNGSDSQLVNINAGGTDVDAYSYKNGITLTDAELAALLADASAQAISGERNVAAFADLTGDAQAAQRKRSVALAANFLSA